MIKEACKVLEDISKTSSRNEKIEILKANRSKELEFLLDTAFNPYLTYGVTGIFGEYDGKEVPTLKELQLLREELNSRKVTGDKARSRLACVLSSEYTEVTNWLNKIFSKDLKIGIDRKTINKVYKNLIPEFTLQLCDKFKPGMDLSYWIVEPKYDGLRCVMIFNKGEGVVLSRNGKPLYNVGHIVEELLPLVKEGVLDGEIYGSDWADSASTFRASKATKTSESGKFHMFDYLTLEDFKNRTCKKTWLNRKAELDHIPDTEHAIKVRSQIVENTEQAWDKAKEFLERGFEGAVAKNPASHYSFDRNLDWVKLKFEDTEDLPIVAYEEGTGRNKGRLGALVCETNKGIRVNIGGGYTDDQRTSFWKHRNELIGQVIEVKFQEKTPDGSLRFPVYVSFRNDKEVI